ncbi:sulfatase-like hydrolase/transferase [Endozoicomonas lisbonensis]|uniref:sulfatase-like hydrolase/transferase n=1 Tax=Endozoicomonas lisbonensis TaxID=3120522 RepID=UPI0033953461
MYRNDEPVPNFDEYLTDRFGSEAIDYIEKRKDEPFFLFVPFNAIHGPLQAKEEDLEKFKHIEEAKRLQKDFDQWNAKNEPSRWGWNKQNFPYTNGWRKHD